jgi:hypothetical protein
VLFDPSSPLLSAVARLFARLDAFDRLKFEADQTPATAWTVVNAATGERTAGVLGFAECVDALAFGRPLGWMLRTGPGQKLAQFVARWMTHREAAFTNAFAWEALSTDGAASPVDVPASPVPAAEVPAASTPEAAAPPPELVPLPAPAPPPAPVARVPRYDEPDQGPPVQRWLRRRTTELREIALVVLIVASGSQVLMENKAVPAQLKWGQPKWMQQIVSYPRLFQGWGMFSSDVPVGERMLYVDAVTFGGRHVDPFNEAGSRVATLPVERIPEHMEQDEFWCDYTNRIPERQVYWRMLKEWILAYHLRTMRREDRVLSFEAKLIESDSPPPGEHEARNIRTKVMMTDRDP